MGAVSIFKKETLKFLETQDNIHIFGWVYIHMFLWNFVQFNMENVIYYNSQWKYIFISI